MEYVFGRLQDGSENVKTIDSEHSNLLGHQSLVSEYPDQVITDEFDVIEKYHSEIDTDGKYYDWYRIKNRQRIIDKSEAIKEDYDAKITYLSMMTGVIFPEDDEGGVTNE